MKPDDLDCLPDLQPRFGRETNGPRSLAEPLELLRLGLASPFAPAGQRSPDLRGSMSSALEARLCQVLGSKRAECQHEDQEAEKAQELSARTFRKVTRAPFGRHCQAYDKPVARNIGLRLLPAKGRVAHDGSAD